MVIKFKKINPALGHTLPAPDYATAGAAGIDMVASLDNPIVLAAGEKRLIPTGIAVDIGAENIVGLLFARSGLAIKKGISLVNGVGVIDSDYKGEIFCALQNNNVHDYEIKPGDRIAQLIFMPILLTDIVYTDKLNTSLRGKGCLGSTGR